MNWHNADINIKHIQNSPSTSFYGVAQTSTAGSNHIRSRTRSTLSSWASRSAVWARPTGSWRRLHVYKLHGSLYRQSRGILKIALYLSSRPLHAHTLCARWLLIYFGGESRMECKRTLTCAYMGNVQTGNRINDQLHSTEIDSQRVCMTPFLVRKNMVQNIWNANIRIRLVFALVTPLVGAVIGAIHCTLWNSTFVNSNGQLLWRICCVVQICAPFCSFLLTFLTYTVVGAISQRKTNSPNSQGSNGELYDYLAVFSYSVGGFVFFLYFCARIVLFILIGYSFLSLPMGVYSDVDWSLSWFPHWH